MEESTKYRTAIAEHRVRVERLLQRQGHPLSDDMRRDLEELEEMAKAMDKVATYCNRVMAVHDPEFVDPPTGPIRSIEETAQQLIALAERARERYGKD